MDYINAFWVGGLMAKLEALQKEQERLQQERMNKGKK